MNEQGDSKVDTKKVDVRPPSELQKALRPIVSPWVKSALANKLPPKELAR